MDRRTVDNHYSGQSIASVSISINDILLCRTSVSTLHRPRCDERIDHISIIIHRSAVALIAGKLFSEIFCSNFQYTASLRLPNTAPPSDVRPDSTGSDLVHKADIPYISCNCKSNFPTEMINLETRAMTFKTKTLIIINIDVCTTFLRKNTEKWK